MVAYLAIFLMQNLQNNLRARRAASQPSYFCLRCFRWMKMPAGSQSDVGQVVGSAQAAGFFGETYANLLKRPD
jgi:hypothetical protein